MTNSYRVAVIAGDGIGREVVPEGIAVMEAAARRFGFALEWREFDWSCETYLKTGSAPSIRTLGKDSGVTVKELYQLFPKGPAKLAAKIGGIPKPQGCI